jgi:2-oxoglutarate dehydrogenase E1 component
MEKYSYINNTNPAFVEDLYLQYKSSPESVDPLWQKFFEGFEYSQILPDTHNAIVYDNKDIAVIKLIEGYRTRGHLIAETNPVRKRRQHKSDLELSYFGLSESDMDTEFEAGKELGLGKVSLRAILDYLRHRYCGAIGAEYMYCRNEKLRHWIQERMESSANTPEFSRDEKLHILKKIHQSVFFESFLQTKYVGKKRFSLEGLEAFIPALDACIQESSRLGAKEIVVGMAHRGRLNVLVNIFEKSYETVFAEFDENVAPEAFVQGGDVKYHLGKSADVITPNGNKIHLSMLFNPSHLETVSAVLQGVTYAKKTERYNNDARKILPVIIHGDSAISGQGINYEIANMANLQGFNVGGALHIVLNNQVGFTTNYLEARSSVYCTDIAKLTECPVFHVNADNPEAVVQVMHMALQIRQEFGIDVYIDILGYRRHGHNEGDEPRFTQPILYKTIEKHPNLYKIYLEKLTQDKVISSDEADAFVTSFQNKLQERLDYAKKNKIKPAEIAFQSHWLGYRAATLADFEKSIPTGVSLDALKPIAAAISSTPDTFNVYGKMKKILDNRRQLFEDGQVDWAMAELLAYGTLLQEQHPVRLAGQDAQRGTFSHRHAVIRDAETEALYTPLNHIDPKQATFSVYNTLLSEYGCMGFEYGYSLASPHSLVIWEAQFGDFANGAQIIIDQFLSSSETKWERISGLTLLLPHGHEGQGPEHSSARLERFLQLCAQENMIVANVTTPSNFFHLLRRQVHSPYRKPLVVMSPKSLFRHPKVVSPVTELTNGQFQEIIINGADPKTITKVVMCTGKIYYELEAKREELGKNDVAIIRLEQLYPLPQGQLNDIKQTYSKVNSWVWAQEEPSNQGSWAHIVRLLPDWNFRLVSRKESASPATGSQKRHEKVQAELVQAVFE